jgi:hypothetical protein
MVCLLELLRIFNVFLVWMWSLLIDEDLQLPAGGVRTDLLDEPEALPPQSLRKQTRFCGHDLFGGLIYYTTASVKEPALRTDSRFSSKSKIIVQLKRILEETPNSKIDFEYEDTHDDQPQSSQSRFHTHIHHIPN